MTDKQPDALRLAGLLELAPEDGVEPQTTEDAAAELRRLHAENEALASKLKAYEDLDEAASDVQLLRMGYAAARLEIESLRARSVAPAMGYEHQCAIMEDERRASLDAFDLDASLTRTEERLYETAFTNGWDRAMRAAQPAGAQQPDAAYAALPDADRDYMRKVVAVAVTMLFDGYKGDVTRVFSTGELSEFVTITAAMGWERVEDIYRRAWDLLSLPVRASHGQAPAQAAPAYKDSTPELHVGDSAFENWYSTYNPAHKADKQRARDAYAAGMGDPLVTAAPDVSGYVSEWAGGICTADEAMDGIAKLYGAQAAPAAGAVTGSGEVVAHRVVRKSLSGDEWASDARDWSDGPPSRALVDSIRADKGRWRIDVAYAAPATPQPTQPQPVAPSEPTPAFDDPRVQAVYEILCDDTDWPPKEAPQQHWEGWIARRIVERLFQEPVVREPLTPKQVAEIADAAHREYDRLVGSGQCAPRWSAVFAHLLERAHGIGIKGGQHGAE